MLPRIYAIIIPAADWADERRDHNTGIRRDPRRAPTSRQSWVRYEPLLLRDRTSVLGIRLVEIRPRYYRDTLLDDVNVLSRMFCALFFRTVSVLVV